MALDLLQACPSKVVQVEPFALLEASRRRRVVGLDVWMEVHPRTPVPISSALVAALCPTHARLIQLADLDGRCAWPGDEVADATQLRCRILVRDDDMHLNDAALAEVLPLGGVGGESDLGPQARGVRRRPGLRASR